MKNISKFESPATYLEVGQNIYAQGREQENSGCNAHAEVYYKCAVECFEQAARGGSAEAMFILAECFDKGRVANKDLNKTFAYYRRAAEKGYEPAFLCLAEMYEIGLGTGVNDKKALFWYKKAAEKGDAFSQRWMGSHYASMYPPDYKKATEWYEKAAAQGDKPAIKALEELRKKTD